MSLHYASLCLLFFGTFFSSVSAQLVIDNESTLTPDDVIRAGKVLEITCNADAVGVPSQLPRVQSVKISRQLYGSTDMVDIVVFDPYNTFVEPQVIQNPDGREWEFEFSDTPSPPNTRNLFVKWTITDTKCADAAIYQCTVGYVDGLVSTTKSGQQNVSSRAAIRNLFVTVSPQLANYEYTENDNVTISCAVDGPRNILMVWQSGLASAPGFLQEYGGAVMNEDPAPVPNDECDSMRYRSTLSIQLQLADNEMMYKCISRYDNDPEQSANLTLSISAAAVIPVGGGGGTASATSGGGNDAGMIVGIVIGVLAFIVIVLLLVYFCWYRKRNDNNKDAEDTDTKPDMHAPPPVFYSKPNKPPKDDKDDGAPVGMTNIALDTSYDSNTPPRYANPDQEPASNGPPGYATDDDTRRARYNKAYAPDDSATDQGDSRDSRDNYSRRRRDRGDRRERGSRSRDHPDNPRSQSSYDYDEPSRQPAYDDAPQQRDDGEYVGQFGAEDGTDNYAPDYRYNNLPQGGFGDPSIGTAI